MQAGVSSTLKVREADLALDRTEGVFHAPAAEGHPQEFLQVCLRQNFPLPKPLPAR